MLCPKLVTKCRTGNTPNAKVERVNDDQEEPVNDIQEEPVNDAQGEQENTAATEIVPRMTDNKKRQMQKKLKAKKSP